MAEVKRVRAYTGTYIFVQEVVNMAADLIFILLFIHFLCNVITYRKQGKLTLHVLQNHDQVLKLEACSEAKSIIIYLSRKQEGIWICGKWYYQRCHCCFEWNIIIIIEFQAIIIQTFCQIWKKLETVRRSKKVYLFGIHRIFRKYAISPISMQSLVVCI